MELVIDRLTRQFKNIIAVDRVSLTLNKGVYGLLGAFTMVTSAGNPTKLAKGKQSIIFALLRIGFRGKST